MIRLIFLLGLVSLGGCSIFEGSKKEIIFDDVVGPDTKLLAKELPDDLRGDSENKRYTGTKIGAGLEKEDPDGGR